ncbi:MAG: CoA ester lyase [Ilumatobacteraceae bacterium]|nr:CoA ester lyase [Ilumatobacteraceae bacterium]
MPIALADARSFFITAGTNEEVLRQALASAAHAVVADFEDMVPPDQKAAAREVARRVFAEPTNCLKLVRINAPDSDEHAADMTAMADMGLDGIVVPKATPAIVGLMGDSGPAIVGLVETGEGVRLAYETACMPRVVLLAIAPGDLSKDLRMQLRPDGQSLLYTRSKLVVDSAAAGIRAPIDIPSANLDDALRADVQYSRSLGLWGRLCLRPGQAEVINEIDDEASAAAGH